MRGTGGARARGEKKRGARTLIRAGEAAQVRGAYLSTIEPTSYFERRLYLWNWRAVTVEAGEAGDVKQGRGRRGMGWGGGAGWGMGWHVGSVEGERLTREWE